MYASRLDIPSDLRTHSIAALQARLSDALDLGAQMRQALWNARGPDALQLCELFDTSLATVEDLADKIAERLRALGGIADGRVQTSATETALPKYPADAADGIVHLKAVARSLARFGALVHASIEHTANLGDTNTSDMFAQISKEADRQLCLVEAHLTLIGTMRSEVERHPSLAANAEPRVSKRSWNRGLSSLE